MKSLTTLLALLISLSITAHLAPTSCAPIGQHLSEVNNEWTKMWPEMANSMNYVSFENEADRIRIHLNLVVEKILPGSSPTKAALLRSLQSYAQASVFPRNYLLPYRNPIFIDPHGTACAVGHLMIESGNRILAERIDAVMETYYVRDMEMDEIFSWAEAYDFSADELAWIQPAYPPSTFWTAPGGGLNGEVDAMTRTASGLLIVAGKFDLGGPVSFSEVASWDGTSYTRLGNGLSGTVFDLIEFGGDIHAVGSFYMLNSFYDHATWDGSNWVYGTIQQGMVPVGFDLHIHDGELYAAGESSGFVGVTNSVMKLQSGSWTFCGDSFTDTIHTMESFDGKLMVGGKFTSTLSGVPVNHIAYLDSIGNWNEAYGGLNAPVKDLAVVFSSLYAGGTIGDTSDPSFGLSVVWQGNSIWTDQLDYTVQNFMSQNGRREITCLQLVGSQLFAGGSFEVNPLIGVPGQNIMWIDQGSGFGLVQATMDGPVHCMEEGMNTSLYIGGNFTTMNAQNVPNIGWTDVSVMSVPEQFEDEIRVWPSPSAGVIEISAPSGMRNDTYIITDITGSTVWNGTIKDSDVIDLTHLSNGTYVLAQTDTPVRVSFVISR